jgi:Gpi18-like mannosyltransferase
MTTWSDMPVWVLRTSLVAASILAFGNTLDNSFHYDDSHSIVENYHLRSLGNIPEFFTDPGQFSREPAMAMYRPLLLVTFALNYAFAEYEPLGYHLVNILAHVLAALLVYSIASSLTSSRFKGWWTGMFFALHPVHSQAVNYISARSEVISVLMVLVAFYLVVVSRKEALASLAYAAGLMVKSSATVFVPLLLMHRGCDPGKRAR